MALRLVFSDMRQEVEHVLINNGTKNEQGQIDPRPMCSCGEVMPVGIKTSPQGWHYMHVQTLDRGAPVG